MKKLYSLFLTLFALLCAGFTTQAQDANSYTITFKSSTGSSDASSAFTTSTNASDFIEEGIDYFSSISATNNVYLGKNNYGIKFSSAKINGVLTLALSVSGKVNATKIVVNAAKYGSDASKLAVNSAEAQSLSSTDFTDYEFAVTGEISEIKLTATKRLYVKSVTVYSDADSRGENGLAYSAEACTVTVGEAYELPVLSNPNNLDVTYASSNTAVATVSETGVVTIPENSIGETTISATFAGNDTYKAGKASYVLTVKNPNLPGYSAEKPFTVAQAIEACTADGPKDIYVKGIITSVESFNSTYGSLTYYIGDEAGATTTLQVYGGLNIGGEKFTGMDDLAVGGTVLVNGNLKLYSNKPEIDLNSKIIEYTAPAMLTVDTPTFSVNSGEVENGTTVTIACATEGATIRYSMGASAEDIDENTVENWDVYENAIEITEPVTIKAIAIKDGYINSNIAVASYTIKVPADATFNFAAPETLTPAYPANKDDESLEADGTAGNMQALVNDVVFSQGNVSVSSTNTAEKGTATKIYYQSTGKIQLRVYSGGSTTVKSTDPDNNITKIVFTYNNGSTSYNAVTAPETGTWVKTTGTWTGNAQEVTFNYTGTQQINAIDVFCAEGLTAGVDNVVVDNDENAPIEYYNLQGVRVENPAAGQLYIKRQGSKATKVIIR